MNASFRAILFFLAISHCSVLSYKILAVFPISVRSHFDVLEPLLRSLSQRGHEVTVISHFPRNETLPNYVDISLAGTYPVMKGAINLNNLTGARHEKYLTMLMLADFAKIMCESVLSSDAIQNFVNSKKEFNVVITEHFNTNCAYSILQNITAPTIGISTCAMLPWTNDYFGNPDNPSYIPISTLDNYVNIPFWRRVENTLMLLLSKMFNKLVLNPLSNEMGRKYINENATNLEEYAYNTSLLLLNTHYSLQGSRPFVPNIIEVGGIHIGKPKQLAKVICLYFVNY